MARSGPTPAPELHILSVEDILSADDLKSEVVAVPEWGGHVRIQGFSKAKQLAIREEATVSGEFDNKAFEMLLFVYGCVEPAFSSEQMELLKGKNAAVVDRVLSAIMELGGLTEEARKAAKARFLEGAKPAV